MIDGLDSEPSPNGSQPTATPQSSGELTATLYPDEKFLGENDIYNFEITISNDTGATLNPDVIVTFATNVATDVSGTSATDWTDDYYPSDTNCEVIFLDQEEIGNIPDGGQRTLMLELDLSVSDDVYWTPSINVE